MSSPGTDDLRHRRHGPEIVGLRRSVRFAVSLTLFGLGADLGWIAMEAATRFALDQDFGWAAAFGAEGMALMGIALRASQRQVERTAQNG